MALFYMLTGQLRITVILMMGIIMSITTSRRQTLMLDDFFIRALLAGIGIAIIAAPLGCFVVWRRLAYFGDTLAHSALLGVSFALLFEINITVSVFLISIVISLLLYMMQKRGGLSSDAVLGLLSHSALALGLVAIAFMTWVRIDLNALLFGDILSVSRFDVGFVWAGSLFALAVLVIIWRNLFAVTVNEQLARAEGMNPDVVNMIFMVLMALVIAISMQIVGVLLITALLIIPAASARQLATGPEQMAVVAAIIGIAAVVGGLYASLGWDTPSGPSIVVMALMLFIISLVLGGKTRRHKPNHAEVLPDSSRGE
jgi:zinc transport system permease protein